ncbi:hypothetical protein ACLBVR_32360, partial [Pseudomonas aeruginosa]|uniref:hypothetical protein n=1 Tax=Pseudomonas aeruginosa TaxID=287 RepID=UPI0039694E80
PRSARNSCNALGMSSPSESYRTAKRHCRHSRMTVVVAGGMHDADTRGGLGHRRDWSPDPSACMDDAVEMDIASGVPGFYR